jgi:hypothetical protein
MNGPAIVIVKLQSMFPLELLKLIEKLKCLCNIEVWDGSAKILHEVSQLVLLLW